MKTIKALLFTLIILVVAVVLALLPTFFGEVGIVRNNIFSDFFGVFINYIGGD